MPHSHQRGCGCARVDGDDCAKVHSLKTAWHFIKPERVRGTSGSHERRVLFDIHAAHALEHLDTFELPSIGRPREALPQWCPGLPRCFHGQALLRPPSATLISDLLLTEDQRGLGAKRLG